MVSVIVPAWIVNVELAGLMQRFINTLRETTRGKDMELIIVDNASPYLGDEMSEWASIYIRNPENIGYTKAVNQGADYATGDVLVIANDDVGFTEGWLGALIEGLREAKVSTLRQHEGERAARGVKFGFLWAIRRSDWKKYKGLDEQFEQTFSDTDLWKRIGRDTVRMNHLVEHAGSKTLEVLEDREEEYEASKAKFIKKHGREL